MMNKPIRNSLVLLLGVLVAGTAMAAGADLGQTAKQATNWVAIIMFGFFVIITLFITKWAANKTKTAADFYNAGGGISGFQNVWRSPATTCRRRPSSAYRVWCSATVLTV